ncbi:helix-turn-helix transcriptional regulator [Vallitalea pronyensis]|uniref:Helix-turn-helix transcriptional regulator n=1 Tax=Vallitalea pronyensis TaxID=1348613 RepID=A0A8J8MLI2_9FIRM|nr:AraC family transcriptional regulator [Vallitalea pronyensis]QUI24062.1 helix-turn-helix transcriptional regulator [Vallitalea pronyensis]
MEAYKEDLITINDPFPVEVFIQNNEKAPIIVEPHWHDCIEVLYILEGQARQQVNEQTFYVETGDVLVISKGDIHGTWCERNDVCKILVLKFLPDVIKSASIYDSKYIHAFLQNKKSGMHYLKKDAFKKSNIRECFMGVLQEYENKELAHEIFIKGYIHQIIAILIRNGTLTIYPQLPQEDELQLINPLIVYIERHYDERITLQQAANMVNMSYYHFSRYFKKVTGRNFKEYVDFVRVSEAERRLISSNKLISEIAYEVGYNNLSSFNRVYKRIRGYPPSKLNRAKTDHM